MASKFFFWFSAAIQVSWWFKHDGLFMLFAQVSYLLGVVSTEYHDRFGSGGSKEVCGSVNSSFFSG